MLGTIDERPRTQAGYRSKRRGLGAFSSIFDERPESSSSTLRPSTSVGAIRRLPPEPPSSPWNSEVGRNRPASSLSRASENGEAKSLRPPSLLAGVSWDAERQNAQTGRGLTMLLRSDGREKLDPFASRDEPREAAGPNLVDEQGFVRTSDFLSTSIEALRGRHTAFEGVPIAPKSVHGDRRSAPRRRSLTGMGVRPTSARSNNGGEDDANFAERLQAYKYVRKYEREEVPELSATLVLGRNASCPGLGKAPKPPSHILKYNASDEALQLWFPEARKRMLDDQKAARRTRAEEANVHREQQMMASSVRWSKAIQRKKEQGDQAIASRRNCLLSDRAWSFLSMSSGGTGASPPSSPTSDSAGYNAVLRTVIAEQWMQLLMVVGLVQELIKTLEFKRMDHPARMAFLETQPRSSTRILMRSSLAQQSIEMDRLMHHVKPHSNTLMTLACVFRTALKVRMQRRSANMIMECMTHWQVAGRAFVSMRRFATWIKKLQRWWRACSAKLREDRDMISARWDALEKAAIANEEQQRHDSYVKTGARFQGPSLGTTAVSEAARLRFIEHELRARRVMLLPLLYIWEEDVRKWRHDLEEWRETRAAHKALGIDGASTFRWPPTRPSSLPPAHPNHEAWGLECPEECPGRRGDDEILEMWRKARRHPKGGGWQKIPCAGCTQKFSKSEKGGSRAPSKAGSNRKAWEGGSAMGQNQDATSSASPFGEAATDEELRQWGIDATTLPGL
mmetsp:Transcript_108840/g.318454  ORF Transcript_108840/g.318454 Transcript_108840/m.318454 type:complete len:736 (-) Transcript_108840:103-2310(-)